MTIKSYLGVCLCGQIRSRIAAHAGNKSQAVSGLCGIVDGEGL
ncbi:hypothetical protein [Pectobacterium polaris]|nr:hypothetical protein [Pectobacterium polaris]